MISELQGFKKIYQLAQTASRNHKEAIVTPHVCQSVNVNRY